MGISLDPRNNPVSVRTGLCAFVSNHRFDCIGRCLGSVVLDSSRGRLKEIQTSFLSNRGNFQSIVQGRRTLNGRSRYVSSTRASRAKALPF